MKRLSSLLHVNWAISLGYLKEMKDLNQEEIDRRIE
jgi:hypothetical protein